MGDTNRQRLSHPLAELCFFLILIFATGGFEPTKYGCSFPKGGITYTGSLNVTQSGKVCQNWAVNEPHVINNSQITDDMFPDGSKEAAQNFCRNPTLSVRDGVWCYTMEKSVEWEYCNACPSGYEVYNGCSLKDKGADYMGNITRTYSLMTCEPWGDHPNDKFQFKNGSVKDAKNYCRNPDPNIHDAPWCYVSGVPNRTWDYCDICTPFSGEIKRTTGTMIGSFSVPISSMSILACIRWCTMIGSCLGVNVDNRGSRECLVLPRTDGEAITAVDWDHYSIKRVCIAKAGGKTAYFVDNPEVENVDPTANLMASASECENECIQKAYCHTYYRNDTRGMCFFHSNISGEWKATDPSIRSRFVIRCDPFLQPFVDVAVQSTERKEDQMGGSLNVDNSNQSEAKSSEDTSGYAQEKKEATEDKDSSTKLIVVSVVAVVGVGVCGLVYYKFVYLKNKERSKDKDKPGDKGKPGDKDKQGSKVNVKGDDAGKHAGKETNKAEDKGKDKGKDKKDSLHKGSISVGSASMMSTSSAKRSVSVGSSAMMSTSSTQLLPSEKDKKGEGEKLDPKKPPIPKLGLLKGKK